MSPHSLRQPAGTLWCALLTLMVVGRATAQLPAHLEAELLAVFRSRTLLAGSLGGDIADPSTVVDVYSELTTLGTPQLPVYRAYNRGAIHGRPLLLAVFNGRSLQLGGSEAPRIIEIAKALGFRLGHSADEDLRVATALAALADPNGAASIEVIGTIERYPAGRVPQFGMHTSPVGPAVCVEVCSRRIGIRDKEEVFRYCFQGAVDGQIAAWGSTQLYR